MANTKISDLTAITGASLASGDLTVVVDVSDTSMASTGTDKKTTIADIATAVGSAGGLATTAAVAAGYQPLDSDLTAIAALSTTTFGRALLTQADATATNTTLGLGSAALLAASAVFGQAQTVNAQTGTTYTLVAGDAGKLVTLSNASAVTLTVPQDSDATIAVGTYIDLYQLGAGQVTVAAGSGATLRVGGLTAKARAQYSSLGVQKVSANTWRLFGDLASS